MNHHESGVRVRLEYEQVAAGRISGQRSTELKSMTGRRRRKATSRKTLLATCHPARQSHRPFGRRPDHAATPPARRRGPSWPTVPPSPPERRPSWPPRHPARQNEGPLASFLATRSSERRFQKGPTQCTLFTL